MAILMPTGLPLYLDHAASTPPMEEVIEAMLPWLGNMHANPHSPHIHGRNAAAAIEDARESVARLIGASDTMEIIFTSGATEANNLALKGLLGNVGRMNNLLISNIEHKSISEPARFLSTKGINLKEIGVNSIGTIDLRAANRDIEAISSNSSGILAFSHSNSEIGTVQPLSSLVEIAHSHGFLCHIDASQSAGKICVRVDEDDVDMLCISSHKLNGPVGIGALFLRSGLHKQIVTQLHGGGQEHGVRSGTVPTFLAVGMGVAAKLVVKQMDSDRIHLDKLTVAFQDILLKNRIQFTLLGDPIDRIPGHLSVRFIGINAQDLLASLMPKLSVSISSACTAGEVRASSVLRAIGLDEESAGQVIRISFGRTSSFENALNAGELIVDAINRIQNIQ